MEIACSNLFFLKISYRKWFFCITELRLFGFIVLYFYAYVVCMLDGQLLLYSEAFCFSSNIWKNIRKKKNSNCVNVTFRFSFYKGPDRVFFLNCVIFQPLGINDWFLPLYPPVCRLQPIFYTSFFFFFFTFVQCQLERWK